MIFIYHWFQKIIEIIIFEIYYNLFNISENENENVLKNIKNCNKKKFEDYYNKKIIIIDFKSEIVHKIHDKS